MLALSTFVLVYKTLSGIMCPKMATTILITFFFIAIATVEHQPSKTYGALICSDQAHRHSSLGQLGRTTNANDLAHSVQSPRHLATAFQLGLLHASKT